MLTSKLNRSECLQVKGYANQQVTGTRVPENTSNKQINP